MPQRRTYQDEAYDYLRERTQRLMSTRVPRNLVIKGSTLIALGGASGLAQLMAACTQAGSTREATIGTSAEGSFKYSKYPLIEKYNWRNLPWGGTPYVDGVHVQTRTPPSNWDFVRRAVSSEGYVLDTLLNKRYGPQASMEKDELVGHLADKWTTAPDHSYTDYHVRPGMYFHDLPPVNGRLCTAEDVKYSLDAYRTVGLAKASLEIIDRVEVLPDKETVRVYVKKPVLWLDYTIAAVDLYIFAREHFEGPKDRWEQQPIGTGPFKVVNVVAGSKLEALRHEKFGRAYPEWPGAKLPFLKGYTEFVVGADATFLAAIRSGQTDYERLSDYVQLQDVLSTNPELIVQVNAQNATYSQPWVFNLRDPLFQDIRVRRALSMAINRNQMIETLAGNQAAGSHPINWTWLERSDPFDIEELGPWQQYNPTEANRLLAEAGYPNGFEIEYMVSGTPSNRDVFVQQMLEQVGVRVKFDQKEGVVVTNTRTTKAFKHMISNTIQTGYNPIKVAREWFLPDSPRNWNGINDPVITDLVERATYTLDAAEQQRLLKQIHERSMDQVWQLDFYTVFTLFVQQPWLHNVASASQGNYDAFAKHQTAVAWVDDKAPPERRGRLLT